MIDQQDRAPVVRPRRAVVTGATSGLGFATASSLAAVGLQVILVVRDRERGLRAAESIGGGRSGLEPQLITVDLADLDQVRAGAREIVDGGPVDVLVNNAGLTVSGPRQTTRQGFELQMGVNHLAHFVLTAELMPALRQAEQPRVVSVSSLAHRMTGRLDPRLGSGRYQSLRAYAQSKLACGLFGLELARRADAVGSPLVSVVTHPGWTATALFRPSGQGDLGRRMIETSSPGVAMTAADGARSQVQAAIDPALHGGEYLGPRWLFRGAPRLEVPAANMRDHNSARMLWELSEDRTGSLLRV
jgi:NAD(P)-dependent dehydrogenase (short-subunit alcohol dehydrogenase family)